MIQQEMLGRGVSSDTRCSVDSGHEIIGLDSYPQRTLNSVCAFARLVCAYLEADPPVFNTSKLPFKITRCPQATCSAATSVAPLQPKYGWPSMHC